LVLCPELVESLRNGAKDAKLLWATTTPVREPNKLDQPSARTECVRERNKLGAQITEREKIPVDDLFALVTDHPKYHKTDGVHFGAARNHSRSDADGAEDPGCAEVGVMSLWKWALRSPKRPLRSWRIIRRDSLRQVGSMTGDVLNIDLVSQSFMQNPFPALARMREVGALVQIRLPILGKTWVATTHDAVSEVLKDDGTFVRDARNAGKRDAVGFRWWAWLPRSIRVLNENMLGHDGPDHRRLRKLVDQAFSRHSVEGMRPRIAAICDGLLDRMAGGGVVDLMEGLARPLPLTVICELLGLPEEDRPRFRQWARAIMSIKSLWGIFRFMPALFRLVPYFERHFEQCRRGPRPGLMTALVQAEQDGDRLSADELLAMAFLLLLAGHETTVHLIGGGTLALLEEPEQKARLTADWSLLPSAVEELLRFVCPVQLTKPRYLARDLEFRGRSLHRGDVIIPMLASANADPARFHEPQRLNIGRSPNPHVAFGTGSHFCLGAQLARVEVQVVLEKLFTRFPDLSLAVPGVALKYTGRLGMRALTALPVRLR
jgi:cytochrome P450